MPPTGFSGGLVQIWRAAGAACGEMADRRSVEENGGQSICGEPGGRAVLCRQE